MGETLNVHGISCGVGFGDETFVSVLLLPGGANVVAFNVMWR